MKVVMELEVQRGEIGQVRRAKPQFAIKKCTELAKFQECHLVLITDFLESPPLK
jgi:hypothetical protein